MAFPLPQVDADKRHDRFAWSAAFIASSRIEPTTRRKRRHRLARIAAAVGLLCPGAVLAQSASAPTYATTTIRPFAAITTRQDFVLGSVLLRFPQPTRSLALNTFRLAHASDMIATADPSTSISAVFTLPRATDHAISVDVPLMIDLIQLGGSEVLHLATHTSRVALSGSSLPALTSDSGEGMMSFIVNGRLLLDRDAVGGLYRGTLLAIAQYN